MTRTIGDIPSACSTKVYKTVELCTKTAGNVKCNLTGSPVAQQILLFGGRYMYPDDSTNPLN